MHVPWQRRRTNRPVRILGALPALAVALAGCGSATSAGSRSTSSSQAQTPAYVNEPPTPQQLLVERGARLVVADGCAACHLAKTSTRTAPSFERFAGEYVTLLDGRRALVEERFLREALLDPGATLIRGFDPTPMLAAVRRLQLMRHPQQVAALAAFIEQIGPEPE